ncbi:lipopolysaccharide heptosyltransferase II [Pleionea sp. CnH1-48]|uniref:lipopolysaccharide heptosyltransferase II n=1 Tax=Pleionea sp. CnH1-48 TaxID=2954494 RepID=UPI002096B5CD|nr:lipopolysaccharide heptosyltransferase II [Pleionea sp. CnH1-48]MCO7227311.1 lipopolysaccharide heptosyltransferase II [Pleionea sp. CnH1-48]
MTRNNAILIVGPSWIGDMVMAQSLFKMIKQQQPDVEIDVLAPKWTLGTIARMPEVRDGIELDVKHGEIGLGKRYRVGKALREKKYKQVYVLPKTVKSALAPLFAKIPLRTGILGESRYGLINDIKPFDKKILNQTVKKYASLCQSIDEEIQTPYPELVADKANAQRLLTELNIKVDRLTVGFMPGAEYGPAKQWPLEHFATLANLIKDAGGQTFIFGSPKDKADGDKIAEACDAVVNLCGKTTIEDAIDLIAMTNIVVTNDSGLMHVSAALGLPLVCIYGSSSPLYTPPLSDKAKVEWLKLECAPCHQRQCPLGHLDCLYKITPAKVFEHIMNAQQAS